MLEYGLMRTWRPLVWLYYCQEGRKEREGIKEGKDGGREEKEPYYVLFNSLLVNKPNYVFDFIQIITFQDLGFRICGMTEIIVFTEYF